MKVVSTQLLFAAGGEKCRLERTLAAEVAAPGIIWPTSARPSVYPETPTKESSSSPSMAHGVTTEGLLQVVIDLSDCKREDSRCLERESADWFIASKFCSDGFGTGGRARRQQPNIHVESTGAERGRVHRPSPSAKKPAYPVLTSSVQVPSACERIRTKKVTTPGRLTSVTPSLRFSVHYHCRCLPSHLPCLWFSCAAEAADIMYLLSLGTTDHGLEPHVSSISPKHRKSGFMFFFDRTLSPLVPVCSRPPRECVQHVYQIAALRSLRLRLLSCCWPRQ
ncbi:hypothetical protein GE21DRAFT_1274943 [Neurospora crassa]|nr:hypothetical protein GE21DRAFT_1274943 [Neurospora crassa]